MHGTIRRRARAGALCLLPLLAAACGRSDAADNAKADAAPADSSAMGIARGVLGPEVRMAVPFEIQPRDARFIAAALPVMKWVDDVVHSGSSVEPGGYELVILELRGGSWAVHKPGLYTTRRPFLQPLDDTASIPRTDSVQLARMAGVEDADGDGFPEVWAARFQLGQKGYLWELRAFNRDRRILYTARLGSPSNGEGLDPETFEFNDAARQNEAARQWLVRKAQELDAQWLRLRHDAGADSTPAAGTAR